jgi:alkaline phosphatase D
MLDNRFYRSPNNRVTGEKTLFGKQQLNWLIDALKSSKATFKVICSGGQILNTAAKYENMIYLFPEERTQLLALIEKEQISGVVIVSGDRHHSELSKLERPNNYPLYEITVSPLTAGPAPQSVNEANTLRVPETFVGQRNFGILEFTGPRKERQMHIRIYDSVGALLWQKSIASTELQVPK